jgi:hypothetical protein
MVGVGGLIGSLVIVSWLIRYNAVPHLIILIVLAGIIATARLYLKQHDQKQIYAGFFLGLLTQISVFIAFLFFNFDKI